MTTPKLADGAVTSAKIANGAVGNTQLSINYAGSAAKGSSAYFAEDAAKLGGRAVNEFALLTDLGNYVPKTGGTMTGTLNLPANGFTVGGNQLGIFGGNVGIGTSSPAFKLHVAGSFGADSLNLTGGTITTANGSLRLQSTTTQQGTTGGYLDLGPGNFYYPGGTVTLGAGTNSPTYGSGVGSYIKLYGNDYHYGGNILIASGHSYGSTNGQGTGGEITLSTSTAYGGNHPPPGPILLKVGGNERFRVNGDGNIGIRTASPTEALEVVGNIKASGNFTGNSFSGNGSGLTNVSASSLNCVSCVTAGQVGFNFAGSASQGGAATSALTANNAQMLGGVAPSGYAPASGSPNYAPAGQYVNSINSIPGNVNLAAGNNVSIAQNGNTLTISVAQPSVNPQQAALLRWYQGNKSGPTFTAGNAPCGVVYDGSNIWVSSNADNTVSKIRPGDGHVLGTYSVGTNPCRMAYDGANVWVANTGGGNISKILASDGAVLATIPVGSVPSAVAFDGENIWVTAHGDSRLVKIRASDGSVLGSIAVSSPSGVAFDGTNVWVANNVINGTVTKIAGSGPLSVMAVYFTGQSFTQTVVFDGANIWTVNSGTQSISKLRAADGVVLATLPISFNTVGMTFDGSNIWVPSQFGVYKYRASDATLLGIFPRSPTNYGNAAFDGVNIWVTNPDQNTIVKY